MADFNGAGEVMKTNQHVCNVQYRLQQRETAPGEVKISGEITVDQAERISVIQTLASGELFTLRLQSGKQLEVYFNRKDEINGLWLVVIGPGSTTRIVE